MMAGLGKLLGGLKTGGTRRQQSSSECRATERPSVNFLGRILPSLVGLDGLEPTTSVLSGPRSNHLSYRPPLTNGAGGTTFALYPVATCVSRADGLPWGCNRGMVQRSPWNHPTSRVSSSGPLSSLGTWRVLGGRRLERPRFSSAPALASSSSDSASGPWPFRSIMTSGPHSLGN